jgi:ribonuclease-3
MISSRMPRPLDDKAVALVQQAIGYHFKDHSLLKRALTHRSASSEHMERLEFLGDAVLGLTIADYLHGKFPHYSEGELSRMRAALVRKESLMAVSDVWQLERFLIVGEGERKSGRLKSRSIAANGVESLIGAVFQESGWEDARHLIMHAWSPMLKEVDVDSVLDPKSRLQEFTQGKGWGLPEYSVTDHGVGTSPRFSAQCSVNGEWLAKGSGDRKKTAELDAADLAWEALSNK